METGKKDLQIVRRRLYPVANLDRRAFLKGAGAVMASAVLAACARTTEGTTTLPGSGTSAPATIAPGGTTVPGSGPSAVLTAPLNISTDFDYAGASGGFLSWWEQAVSSFADAHGVEADSTNVPFEDLAPRMQAAFAAGEGPTLMPWYANWHSWQFVAQDALEPYDNWLDPSEMDHWLFAGFPIDGQLYMAPVFLELIFLVANTAKLEAAGIELPGRIESWGSFTDILGPLADSGELPVMMGTRDGFNVEQWALACSLAEMDTGLEWAEWEAGLSDPNDPASVGWISNLDELIQNSWVNDNASALSLAEAVEEFRSGQGAFMLMFSGEATAMDPAEFSIIPYWDGPGAAAAQCCAAGSGLIMANYASDEEKATAAEFVKYIHTPEQSQALVDLVGVIPNDDRYEPDLSNEIFAQQYEIINSSPTPHWPTEFMPQEVAFDGLYLEGGALIEGKPAGEALADYQSFIEGWREANPERVELLVELVDAIQES